MCKWKILEIFSLFAILTLEHTVFSIAYEFLHLLYDLGHAVAQWLRHCATNRKVADRFPMVSLEFFIYIVIPVALWPCFNRNKYHEYFMRVKGPGAQD
jgi:hypothetical protein